MIKRDQFQFNVCGEGGEYESAVFDCPLFKKHRIVSVDQEVVHHEDNDFAPVAYLKFKNLQLEEKSEEDKILHQELMNEMIKKRKPVINSEPSDRINHFDTGKEIEEISIGS